MKEKPDITLLISGIPSETVLVDEAVSLSRQLSGTLTLLHVIYALQEERNMIVDVNDNDAFVREQLSVKDLIAEWVEKKSYPLHVKYLVTKDFKKDLSLWLAEHSTDFLMVGYRHHWFGQSLAKMLINWECCPLLVFPIKAMHE